MNTLKLISRSHQFFKAGLISAIFALSANSYAETDNESFVDSVHKWGAWGLDIEPAAGGISPHPTPALNAHGSNFSVQGNDIAALAPTALDRRPVIPAVPAVPATPTTPAIPAIPAIIPISPAVPIVIGGPSDGF